MMAGADPQSWTREFAETNDLPSIASSPAFLKERAGISPPLICSFFSFPKVIDHSGD